MRPRYGDRLRDFAHGLALLVALAAAWAWRAAGRR